MTDQGLPLRAGDQGSAIRDLHRRLAAAGFPATGEAEIYDADTVAADTAFQAARRLMDAGECGPHA